MKSFQLLLIVLFVFTPASSRGVNGGMGCAVCTVLTGLIMQVAEIREDTLVNATMRICEWLPNVIREPCFKMVTEVEPHMKNISVTLTPDLFCLLYGTCTVDPEQQMCHLFPLSLEQKKIVKTINAKKADFYYDDLPKIDFCQLPFIKDICNILNNSLTSLDPVEDFDKDGFSAYGPGRGYDWKGKDCADNNPQMYPGRRPQNSDYDSDTNCNGIWGFENTTLKSWEEILCNRSESRGLIYIGDSIGAHFHMPEVWINSLIFDWPGLNGSEVILNEIDWPEYGFATGFKNISQNILINASIKTDSLYLHLRARNRCNHRDYQNLSQNGASSSEGINQVNSVLRNQSRDKPALVIYAMQGNDVCNNFADTIAHMTAPKEFRSNIMTTLSALNKKLPPRSNVVFIELVEAHFIYSAMAGRVHPVGQLHGNVYYRDMYNWFNCMQIGPCTGWLNSNETLRNITSERARKLSQILEGIVANEKFDNFDLHYVENPINILVNKEKIKIHEFLEPVDSLHPNQKAQNRLSKIVWNSLLDLPPSVLGPINPNNGKIKAIFGNQGGH